MNCGEDNDSTARAAIILRLLSAPLFLLSLGTMAGCGSGSLSENDMRQYALRSSPEPDEEQPLKPAPPSNRAVEPAVERVAGAERTAQPAATPAEDTKTQTDTKPQPRKKPAVASQAEFDTQSSPKEPLGAEERTKRTVANLERIAKAFQKHLDEKDCYPARAIASNNEEHLSWRVALLPYLGYQGLYEEFRLDEPWNSRHNYELLKRIPSVYQSPERFDDHTNYVVPVASSTAFNNERTIRLSNFEDGPKNTLMVVEVDDVAAVPWTAPREYAPDARAPNINLGSLRDGSFFLIWGNAEVGRVLSTAPQDKLRAMFTHDAGEDFNSGQVDQPLFASPERSARPVAATASGEGPTVAATSFSTVAQETSALAAEYSQQSAAALARSDERLGASYFYAAALAGPPGREWVKQFKWVPALRRPAAVVRFGIGLQYAGPQENRLASEDRGTTRSRAWNAITGELGQQLVDVLANHTSSHGDSSLLAQGPAPTKKNLPATRRVNARSLDATGLFAPGIAYLAQARESVLCKLAERAGIDILLVVDWRETPRGWSAGLSLVDIVRGEVVWKAPRILSAKVDRAKTNPLAANPLDDTLRDFTQYLETECIFREIPEKLQRRHAAARVAALSAMTDTEPLRELVEMRLYQELGLVDTPQLVKAYQAKLGDDAGLQLVLGTDDAKRPIFKSLLPAVPLIADRHGAADLRSDDEEE